MELSKEEIKLLSEEIAKKLNENIQFQPADSQPLNTKESFQRFFDKREKYLLNLPIAEIAYMFYLQGISDGPKIKNDISMEELISEIEADTFIESVKGWISMKDNGTNPLPNNPIVEVVKKIIPCTNCQSLYDGYCDGDECLEQEKVEEINLEKQIKENAEC